MRTKDAHKALSVTLSLLLIIASPQASVGYQAPSSDAPQNTGSYNRLGAPEREPVAGAGRADRALPRRAGGPGSCGLDISRPGCGCGILDAAEQESDGNAH